MEWAAAAARLARGKKNHGRTIDKSDIFVYLWIYKRAAMLSPQKKGKQMTMSDTQKFNENQVKKIIGTGLDLVLWNALVKQGFSPYTAMDIIIKSKKEEKK